MNRACRMFLLLWVGLFCTSCNGQAPSTESSADQQSSPLDSAGAFVSLNKGEETWSRFRGPLGDGTSAAKGLPREWGMENNIAWKTRLPGGGSSSPIVWDNHIYLTSYTGYLVPREDQGNLEDLTRHLLCLDSSNGKLLWDRAVPAKQPEESSIRDHGYAANSCVADADHVYAFFGKSGLQAFTHAGEPVWQAEVGDKTHGWGTGSSPILFEDLVIVNASVESESLIAFDRKTGQQKWRAGQINEAWNTPLIVKSRSGEDELVVATHGRIRAYNPRSGDELWTCETDITWYMVPCAVAGEGVVYFLGGRSGTASLAVKTGGRGDVTATHRLWTSKKGSNVSSPVYQDGYLYWANDNLGVVYCAEAATGNLVYEERLPRAGQIYASSLLADGKIYYITRNGRTFVVAAKPEYELLATNDLGDETNFDASPAVLGNQLLLRSQHYLYCIGK